MIQNWTLFAAFLLLRQGVWTQTTTLGLAYHGNSGAPEYVPNTLPDGSVAIESMSYFVINSQLAYEVNTKPTGAPTVSPRVLSIYTTAIAGASDSVSTIVTFVPPPGHSSGSQNSGIPLSTASSSGSQSSGKSISTASSSGSQSSGKSISTASSSGSQSSGKSISTSSSPSPSPTTSSSTTDTPLPMITSMSTTPEVITISTGISSDTHTTIHGHAAPVFFGKSCFLFCPPGCALCGFSLDIGPGIYPPGVIGPPAGWKGPLPQITVGVDGKPHYDSSSQSTTQKSSSTTQKSSSTTQKSSSSTCATSTVTDTTYYVSYATDTAGSTTATSTKSTATSDHAGCPPITPVTTDKTTASGTGFSTLTATSFRYESVTAQPSDSAAALTSSLALHWSTELALLAGSSISGKASSSTSSKGSSSTSSKGSSSTSSTGSSSTSSSGAPSSTSNAPPPNRTPWCYGGNGLNFPVSVLKPPPSQGAIAQWCGFAGNSGISSFSSRGFQGSTPATPHIDNKVFAQISMYPAKGCAKTGKWNETDCNTMVLDIANGCDTSSQDKHGGTIDNGDCTIFNITMLPQADYRTYDTAVNWDWSSSRTAFPAQ